MLKQLHRTSAWLFYLFGVSYFLAYLFWRNEVGDPWPQLWMSIADLPFAVVAMLYGGMSLYRSI